MKNSNIYTVETNSGSLSGAGAWYRLGAQTVVRVRMLPDFLYKEVYVMSIGELFILAVGLSMDAFAVAVCKGLAMERITIRNAGIVGLWFGGFQALMPLIGYLLGYSFSDAIQSVDHWIAFVLLGLIGLNMVKESRECEAEGACGCLAFKEMFTMAVATSIDALAVGITFAFLTVDIIPAVSLIGVTTFILSMAGVKVGSVFGAKYKSKAELAGGIILILLGTKILLEHLGIISF